MLWSVYITNRANSKVCMMFVFSLWFVTNSVLDLYCVCLCHEGWDMIIRNLLWCRNFPCIRCIFIFSVIVFFCVCVCNEGWEVIVRSRRYPAGGSVITRHLTIIYCANFPTRATLLSVFVCVFIFVHICACVYHFISRLLSVQLSNKCHL